MNSSSHNVRRQFLRSLLAGSTLAAFNCGVVLPQDESPNSSLYSGRARPIPVSQGGPGLRPGPAMLDSAPRPPYGGSYSQLPPTSWYEYPLPPQKEVRVKDIITIRVDVAQRQNSEGQVQRRRQNRWDAVLNDWVFLNGLRSVKPAPQTEGDQRVQYNVNQQNRATGTMVTTQSLKFEVATTVQAVLPNGNLVLEAHRKIRDNEELWLVSLSGICRREDIQPGNFILSKDVAELSLEKKELGSINDGYRRGFITRFLDTFSPF
ncbi:MAG: flagellar basal body L-ring protein FlgH [Pirellulaceae bacterium]